ncbi:uncharacterized protein LOC130622136 [Hydractinia symbiolongicarpus]|uniref:uncharacterized protein LOC130622136 n=1 Tax=Hydractinia symbiolongicarpus TaxID=13093 RepID=UPI00254A9719|nr:uncharacterized protein LOC130622136 [Hydractinia symbiolongicarpus]
MTINMAYSRKGIISSSEDERTSKIHRFLIEQLLIKLNKPLKTVKIKEKKEREKILKKRMGLLSQAAKRAMSEMAPRTTFKTTKKERKVAMTRIQTPSNESKDGV